MKYENELNDYFVDRLNKLEDTSKILKEHIEFNDEILSHVLFGDISRYVLKTVANNREKANI